MPKSRLRPNHAQKVAAWKMRVEHAKRRYQRLMNEAMMEQIEAMRAAQSGDTKTNEPVQQTA
jgi:hypothetical protein